MFDHEEPATQPEATPGLPAIYLQMVDNGDGTVGTEVRIGGVDPWTALNMTARAQISLILKIEELEAARSKANAEQFALLQEKLRQASRQGSGLVLPNGRQPRVN